LIFNHTYAGIVKTWEIVNQWGTVAILVGCSPGSQPAQLWRVTSRGGCRLPQVIRTLEQICSWLY